MTATALRYPVSQLSGRVYAGLLLTLFLSLCCPSITAAQVLNPFIGTQGYIDPDYVRSVEHSIELAEPSIRASMAAVANFPTAVWLDSIAAIDGSMGRRLTLEQHLINAVAQMTSDVPVLFLAVIYSLPDRDCSAKASNGTLIGKEGLRRYREEYIDRIAALFADKRFASLRIVTILEPDSLPNLVTNQSVPDCMAAVKNGTYTKGIAYALKKFSATGNVYSYLDIGHSGWLGWEDNRLRAIKLYADLIKSVGSLDKIPGVATNTSGYTPVEEVLLPDPDLLIGEKPIKSAKFYQYNGYFDERDYAAALKKGFLEAGLPDHFGVLIDTSRNGWGGANRPVKAALESTVDKYVNSARVDRRAARNGWCNQKYAGIGERPRADPFNDGIIHSFVWIKPPGESDGTSDIKQTEPDAEGKSFDSDCDPNGKTENGYSTGALDNAPAAGRWFHKHFEVLVRNAYPPLGK